MTTEMTKLMSLKFWLMVTGMTAQILTFLQSLSYMKTIMVLL